MGIYLPQSADIKPPLWAIDPGIVAYNASRMGLPMPVGLWAMWEGSGDRIYDLSGNRASGVFNGNPTWVGDSINLDASGDYILIDDASHPELRITGPMTVFFQCELDEIDRPVWIGLVSRYNTGEADRCWNFFIPHATDNNIINNEINFLVSPNGLFNGLYSVSFPVTDITIGKRHTICGVYTGTALEIYLDGVLKDTLAYSSGIFGDPEPIRIGRFEALTVGMDGRIVQFGLFSAGLTPTQVATISADSYGLVRQPTKVWMVEAIFTTAPPTTLAPTTVPVATTPPPTTLEPTTLQPTTSPPTSKPPTTHVATTPPPTTLAPTTLAPTTLEPTVPPTTIAPTTLPTTAPPTTLAPTTLPTTAAPTSLPPTTLAPTTLPTTAAPTSLPPTTLAPTTLPTTAVPTSLPPTTLAPTTLPTTAAPTTIVPTTLPTTAVPTTLAPTTVVPTTVAPTTVATTVVPTTIVTTLVPTTIVTTLVPTTLAPTVAPTTAIAEACIVELKSPIVRQLNLESPIVQILNLKSPITKYINLESIICRGTA